jgi:hypothetical protein
MKRLTAFVVLCEVILLGALAVRASGPIGVYGIVEEVVFEPDDNAPQRIQIWGVFKYSTEGNTNNPALSSAARGYLYYALPSRSEQADAARKEWHDLKSIAGTGQAIGFGSAWGNPTPRVRPATERPAAPSPYSLNVGVVKLAPDGTQADIVKQLRAALAK